MIDVGMFFLKWMFLSNLCRDIDKIQTLPSSLQSMPSSSSSPSMPSSSSSSSQTIPPKDSGNLNNFPIHSSSSSLLSSPSSPSSYLPNNNIDYNDLRFPQQQNEQSSFNNNIMDPSNAEEPTNMLSSVRSSTVVIETNDSSSSMMYTTTTTTTTTITGGSSTSSTNSIVDNKDVLRVPQQEQDQHRKLHLRENGNTNDVEVTPFTPPPPPHPNLSMQQQQQQKQPSPHQNQNGNNVEKNSFQHNQRNDNNNKSNKHNQQHRTAIRNKNKNWREEYLRDILSHPPNSIERLMALDSSRINLVHQLWKRIEHDDIILRKWKQQQKQRQQTSSFADKMDAGSGDGTFLDADEDVGVEFHQRKKQQTQQQTDMMKSPTFDDIPAVENISYSNVFVTTQSNLSGSSDAINETLTTNGSYSNDDTDANAQKFVNNNVAPPQQVLAASNHLQQLRECLPQFVSALLKSPGPLLSYWNQQHHNINNNNPVELLREFVLRRCCIDDPDLGIRLCWLLEAEVGRAWKTLLEHKLNYPRRRLIIILPADKAIVLAKIGSTKKMAFSLLQDIEQATAYGYYPNNNAHSDEYIPQQHYDNENENDRTATTADVRSSYHVNDGDISHLYDPHYHHHNQRDHQRMIPASLSLLRCRYYGDTMQFIDQLTQISSQLRRIPKTAPATTTWDPGNTLLSSPLPKSLREQLLFAKLHELNRRIRRRMITRGAVTLDVDDDDNSAIIDHHHYDTNENGYYKSTAGRHQNDWPSVEDLTMDMIQYSVHLPLIPSSQTKIWPTAANPRRSTSTSSQHSTWMDINSSCNKTNYEQRHHREQILQSQAVRVLNIVVSETRMLSSRERCPFMIHVEVADTGYECNDPRLYHTTVSTTTSPPATTAASEDATGNYHVPNNGYEAEQSLFTTIREAMQLHDNEMNGKDASLGEVRLPWGVRREVLSESEDEMNQSHHRQQNIKQHGQERMASRVCDHFLNHNDIREEYNKQHEEGRPWGVTSVSGSSQSTQSTLQERSLGTDFVEKKEIYRNDDVLTNTAIPTAAWTSLTSYDQPRHDRINPTEQPGVGRIVNDHSSSLNDQFLSRGGAGGEQASSDINHGSAPNIIDSNNQEYFFHQNRKNEECDQHDHLLQQQQKSNVGLDDDISFMSHQMPGDVRNFEVEQQNYHEVTTSPAQPPLFNPYSSQTDIPRRPKISLGTDLLNLVFGIEWSEKCRQIREASPFGNVEGWRLSSFIMKAGEDIRRESLVMQIISKFQLWFDTELPPVVRPVLRPYTIMCVGGDAGIVECITNAKSVDEIKKRTDQFVSLRDYFERAYGPPSSSTSTGRPNTNPEHYRQHRQHRQHKQIMESQTSFGMNSITFEKAQDNFLRSLVGYSLVCYVLQIKDRHNANILMDRAGHIMHIDYGYVLGDTPKMGKVPIFSERAPFKLSQEFWDVLGGWNLEQRGLGVRFCTMFEAAFACASRHADEIATLVEAAMLLSLPNGIGGTSSSNEIARSNAARACANGVRSRLRMRGLPSSLQQKQFVMDLVNAALTSWGTTTYDWLQRNMNGYQ